LGAHRPVGVIEAEQTEGGRRSETIVLTMDGDVDHAAHVDENWSTTTSTQLLRNTIDSHRKRPTLQRLSVVWPRSFAAITAKCNSVGRRSLMRGSA
jgi:hypothetical protein